MTFIPLKLDGFPRGGKEFAGEAEEFEGEMDEVWPELLLLPGVPSLSRFAVCVLELVPSEFLRFEDIEDKLYFEFWISILNFESRICIVCISGKIRGTPLF